MASSEKVVSRAVLAGVADGYAASYLEKIHLHLVFLVGFSSFGVMFLHSFSLGALWMLSAFLAVPAVRGGQREWLNLLPFLSILLYFGCLFLLFPRTSSLDAVLRFPFFFLVVPLLYLAHASVPSEEIESRVKFFLMGTAVGVLADVLLSTYHGFQLFNASAGNIESFRGGFYPTKIVDPLLNGQLLMFAALAFLAFYFRNGQKYFLGFALVALAGSVASGSRGPLLALIPALLLLIALHWREFAQVHKRGLLMMIGFCVLLLFASYDYIFARFLSAYQDVVSFQSGNFSTSVGQRLKMWEISLGLLNENMASWIFGVGFDGFSLRLSALVEQGGLPESMLEFNQPHNLLLLLLLQGGVLLLVIMLWAVHRIYVMARHSVYKNALAGMALAVIVNGVSSTDVVGRQLLLGWFAVLLGLMLSSKYATAKSEQC